MAEMHSLLGVQIGVSCEGPGTAESQNGRGWQGPLWVTQPNPLLKQGHPEQAAQHCVQAAIKLHPKLEA